MFIKKLEELTSAVKSRNFEPFDDVDDYIDTIEDMVKTWLNYLNTVVQGEVHIRLLSHRYDGEEFRELVKEYDEGRRVKHDAAIVKINMLIRVGRMVGIDFFDGMSELAYGYENRREAAIIIGQVINEIYSVGIHCQPEELFDALVNKANGSPFNDKIVKDLVEGLVG